MDAKQIILLLGLPGSGKSTYINNQLHYSNFSCFDDFKAKSIFSNSSFLYSRFYPDLVKEILSGEKDIILSDISFCRIKDIQEVLGILKWWVNEYKTGHELSIIAFENNSINCLQNIKKDLERDISGREQKILEFSPIYSNTLNYLKKTKYLSCIKKVCC